MTPDIWIRARSGPALGIGHRKRADILADALSEMGVLVGLILDEEAPPTERIAHRLPDGLLPPEEATAYPADQRPVILDLSHPTMLDALPALVDRLRVQGRRIGLIDGLGREAYAPEDEAQSVDLALTPYVLEPDAVERSARVWLHGPQYAVLDPLYAAEPVRRSRDRERSLLVFISGTDPWSLTEHVVTALGEGGLPDEWSAKIVAGPGFDEARREALMAAVPDRSRFELIVSPPDLRDELARARLALLGPGLAKYEAAACGTYSLIVSPDRVYADMNRPFEAAGLATVLAAGPPSPEALKQALSAAELAPHRNPRGLIDGQGAARAAARFVSELITESSEDKSEA